MTAVFLLRYKNVSAIEYLMMCVIHQTPWQRDQHVGRGLHWYFRDKILSSDVIVQELHVFMPYKHTMPQFDGSSCQGMM